MIRRLHKQSPQAPFKQTGLRAKVSEVDTFSCRVLIAATNCIATTAHSNVFAAVSIHLMASSLDHLVALPGVACPALLTKGLSLTGAFGFSFFGFLASLLPRWLLPLAIVCPSE